MPFQFVCVRSSTAWDGPTGGSLALSTSTVIVCSPGVSALRHIEHLRRAERVLPAAKRLVHPHPRVLGALQQQRDPLALPRIREWSPRRWYQAGPFQYHTRESRSMARSSLRMPLWFSSVVPGSLTVSSSFSANHFCSTPTSPSRVGISMFPASGIVARPARTSGGWQASSSVAASSGRRVKWVGFIGCFFCLPEPRRSARRAGNDTVLTSIDAPAYRPRTGCSAIPDRDRLRTFRCRAFRLPGNTRACSVHMFT